MCKLNANGFIVQEISAPTGAVKNFHYAGINAFHSYPLSERYDAKSRHLTDRVFSHKIAEGRFQILEFISNQNLLAQYTALCKAYSIPIRLLFVESTFGREIWADNYPSGNILGYEYCPVPLDEQIITDIDWYHPFSRYWEKLNQYGLFSTFDDAREFKTSYDNALKRREIGDGEMEAYIFRVTEVKNI